MTDFWIGPKHFQAFTNEKKIFLTHFFPFFFFFSFLLFSFFFFSFLSLFLPFFLFFFFLSFFFFFEFSPLTLSCLQNLVPAYKRRLQDCGHSEGLAIHSVFFSILAHSDPFYPSIRFYLTVFNQTSDRIHPSYNIHWGLRVNDIFVGWIRIYR